MKARLRHSNWERAAVGLLGAEICKSNSTGSFQTKKFREKCSKRFSSIYMFLACQGCVYAVSGIRIQEATEHDHVKEAAESM